MDNQRLSYSTILELGGLIRSRQTTPTQLAEHFIDRLETVGHRLNAVVTVTRDLALAQARQAEAELAAGNDRGPSTGSRTVPRTCLPPPVSRPHGARHHSRIRSSTTTPR